MEKRVEVVKGDTPGQQWHFSVLTFTGSDPAAPSVYLQAALHGNELPGVAALHHLVPMLRRAEADGRLAGRVTVVPFANPIGHGQYLLGEHAGRFALGSRVNFNRDFPLLDRPDPALLPGDDAPVFAERRLKAKLLSLALPHDLIIDLHCDDEGVSYIYAPRAFWPGMSDLAAALGSEAAILWDDGSDGAFEAATTHPFAVTGATAGRVATTVEFRGQADVSPELGAADAAGLYRFLVWRGVVRDTAVGPKEPFGGLSVEIENVEMISAPVGGMILYHVRPGDKVKAGERLVTVVSAPGEDGGSVDVLAPQDGTVLTRRVQKMTRVGEDLLKLACAAPSQRPKTGALED